VTSWRDQRYAVIDVETTGLDPDQHEVLSVGVVDVNEGRIDVGSAYYRQVRPRVAPTSETVVVHGIGPGLAAASADPAVVGVELIGRLRGAVLVAHVARIEHSFLRAWLGPLGWVPPRHVVDTDVLARRWLSEHRALRLDGHVGLGAAAGLFGLPEQTRHHALGDALTTAQLFLALAHHSQGASARSIRGGRGRWRDGDRLVARLAAIAGRRRP